MGLFLGWVFLAKIVYVESYNKSFPDAERMLHPCGRSV